ncbi:MAG: hypothetical protein ACXVB4_13570 [Pseudobdellovibrionaceae bacterium]
MKTSIIIFCSLFTVSFNAGALPNISISSVRIPTLGKVLDAVQNAMPISPKSIECEKTRTDAGHHQAELTQTLNGVLSRLNDIDGPLNLAISHKSSFELAKIRLEKQTTLLLEFQNLNTGLVINEITIQSSLYNLQTKMSGQSLNEILQSMESSDQDPKVRQLASIIRSLSLNNSQDISEILQNNTGQTILSQLSQGIGSVQISLNQQMAQNNQFSAENDQLIADYQQKQTVLKAQVAQINAELSAQEERKSCKP